MRVLVKLIYNKIIKKVTLGFSQHVIEEEKASRQFKEKKQESLTRSQGFRTKDSLLRKASNSESQKRVPKNEKHNAFLILSQKAAQTFYLQDYLSSENAYDFLCFKYVDSQTKYITSHEQLMDTILEGMESKRRQPLKLEVIIPSQIENYFSERKETSDNKSSSIADLNEMLTTLQQKLSLAQKDDEENSLEENNLRSTKSREEEEEKTQHELNELNSIRRKQSSFLELLCGNSAAYIESLSNLKYFISPLYLLTIFRDLLRSEENQALIYHHMMEWGLVRTEENEDDILLEESYELKDFGTRLKEIENTMLSVRNPHSLKQRLILSEKSQGLKGEKISAQQISQIDERIRHFTKGISCLSAEEHKERKISRISENYSPRSDAKDILLLQSQEGSTCKKESQKLTKSDEELSSEDESQDSDSEFSSFNKDLIKFKNYLGSHEQKALELFQALNEQKFINILLYCFVLKNKILPQQIRERYSKVREGWEEVCVLPVNLLIEVLV